MDVPPMLYTDNPLPMCPGMVLFMHAILADAEHNLAMSLGRTIDGCEVLSRLALEFHVCN
jgi:Xaa-Pro dipeptidase